jgi:ADP-ribose pyrophosphatase YjhB (NUDIX family)
MENQTESIREIQHFFEKGFLEYRPNLTVDCAIFGYQDGELKLLLEKNKLVTMWCLPGGYVRKDEKLDQAAARTTFERTGIENLFLKQFKTFGDPGRNNSGVFDVDMLFELTGAKLDENSWLNGETTSVGFYAITDIVNSKPKASVLSYECRWFSVDDLPGLAYDHSEMAKEALDTMHLHLYHFPVGKSFLPAMFTLKEIKLFYEVMSGKALHASNFPGKLLSLGLIEKTEEKKSIGAHRSPTYYQFNGVAYEKALKEGMVLV